MVIGDVLQPPVGNNILVSGIRLKVCPVKREGIDHLPQWIGQ
jgi:hypothetical protein